MEQENKMNKKIRLIFGLIGLLLFMAGLAIIPACMQIPRYSAAITEITSTGTYHSSGKRRYKESVNVEYTDENGEAKTLNALTIKRRRETDLPAVGDSISIFRLGMLSGEFSMTTPVAYSIVFVFMGIIFIIVAVKVKNLKAKKHVSEDSLVG